ncbi:7,8-didemethyl-8-hydroxy-5-deazariboflavin synthase CofG [Methanosphaerula palustris]|uniref:7,8-didemethyl-8-hydroxy-5-deazariboflavin synthase n=1 Tax=Methanosphaerula palustris (strain ATCC BAA-1556 / DSM 19958 / E1-9c) TaxID=521011 RepID=COFG_METPE|nr:7,8-didemethyl-8-hydroxy-5-deazariboflavin synthase CofG [Methanosphaerula palustris]B8GGS3.1 RecName: Full=7,8-didemethyl-8-hydroxy-5-deazariboflavin synthase; AltName: Full=FO synthase subunit 1 [Methanosphaerula palustris E1-9c]ACL16328.1 Radical SAM domain protein [Methanosphaerula palustris E1-9c]
MHQGVITFSRNVFLPLTTVCQNHCGYCSFWTPIQKGCIMGREQVIETLRLGAGAGCTEALFTFGERPEMVPGFSEHLAAIGYSSILDYCYDLCKEALRFGILPHTNAGVLSTGEMERLREVNASMGLMLETTADVPAHQGSIGKSPAERLSMIARAGKLRIPFTTGILLGIGETTRDREESLEAIADLQREYGHIQEVIVQNFCPKEGTPMADVTPITTETFCETVRMARAILPEEVAVQVAPNLADAGVLVGCGANDLGGISPVTIDYVNPEHPWPAIDRLTEVAGDAVLRERLCIYPQYITQGWYPPSMEPLIRSLSIKIQERSL